MQTNRRDFLKLALAGTGATLLQGVINPGKVLASSSAASSAKGGKGVLYDITKCVGCRACQNACKRVNEMPADPNDFEGIYDNPFRLSSKTLTLIKYKEIEDNGNKETIYCKYQCMHCEHPACAAACPVGALQKTPEGPVTYDKGRCIGCRYCMVACPFGVPTFDWDKALPWIHKCTFCADRQKQGLLPACVEACPVGALKFGEREELITEARQRIAAAPDKYVNHIYGENEVGGTSWLYLSPVPFEQLAFPDLGTTPVTVDVQRAMGAVPSVLLGVAVAMTGVYAITRRRQKMSQIKAADKEKDKTKDEAGS
jgi:formate dehydrogenase iron-sulfur subunit